jgi:ADP-heptose:LPS heptosyltransferase
MGDPIKRILVIPPYGIGDALMTTPAIRNIGERIDAEITYLHMFRSTFEILRNNPFIKENILFPFLEKSKMEVLRFLIGFRGHSDYSINFYPSNKRDYNIAAFLTGSPVRIGHTYKIRNTRGCHFLKNRTVQEDDNLHCVEENLRLLAFLGIRDRNVYPMEVYLTEDEEGLALRWLGDLGLGGRRLIGVHPGTSVFKNQDRRRWPVASFASLIGRLSHELDADFLLFGGTDERPLREELMSLVGSGPNIISVDLPSVRQAAALIKRCSLFISNDSGPMHIAAAAGVPTVAIFGPTNPAWVRPWGVSYRVVRKELSCSPCFRYSPIPLKCVANKGYSCIRDITVEDIFYACREIIKGKA